MTKYIIVEKNYKFDCYESCMNVTIANLWYSTSNYYKNIVIIKIYFLICEEN